MFNSLKKVGIVAAAGAMLVALPLAANANGYKENVPWQFRDANNIAARVLELDLMEKKSSGYYGPANMTINYNIGTLDQSQNAEVINNNTSIGNAFSIGGGACTGANACNITSTQSNDDTSVTATGVNNTYNHGHSHGHGND